MARRRRKGAVQNWKHGWIPLTPHAALQKAHGNERRANKLLLGIDVGRRGSSAKWRKRRRKR